MENHFDFRAMQRSCKGTDNNTGPNTGGMGSFSPVPDIKEEEIHQIFKKVLSLQSGMIDKGNLLRDFFGD